MRFLKKKVEETELMWGINAWVRDKKFMRGYILMMIIIITIILLDQIISRIC